MRKTHVACTSIESKPAGQPADGTRVWQLSYDQHYPSVRRQVFKLCYNTGHPCFLRTN